MAKPGGMLRFVLTIFFYGSMLRSCFLVGRFRLLGGALSGCVYNRLRGDGAVVAAAAAATVTVVEVLRVYISF